MRISNLRNTLDNSEVRLSVSIESEHLGSRELWFSTPEKYAHGLCKNRLDGFLVGMVFPAMQYGENIHLEGRVSKKLLFNLNNYAIPLLMAFSSSAKRIRITAEETTTEQLNCAGIGTGFSGGVDSFCTIYDRYELEKDPEYRVNSFLFLNVGSHGLGNTEDEQIFAYTKFRNRHNYLSAFPSEVGLDLIPLDSNLHYFHPWGHQLTHTLTAVSGVLIMQNVYSKYYFASAGFSYLELLKYYEAYLNRDVAIFDPTLLPLLSTESLTLIPDGTQYSRIEKTLHIIGYEPVHRYLNVCVGVQESPENCSVCSKCSRTLMTLNSIGKLDEFSRVFDIKKYKKSAELRYVCQQVLLQHKDPFARAGINLAKENGVKLPSCLFCYILIGSINLARVLVKACLPPSMIAKLKVILRQAQVKS
jgi:hypothetical protein